MPIFRSHARYFTTTFSLLLLSTQLNALMANEFQFPKADLAYKLNEIAIEVLDQAQNEYNYDKQVYLDTMQFIQHTVDKLLKKSRLNSVAADYIVLSRMEYDMMQHQAIAIGKIGENFANKLQERNDHVQIYQEQEKEINTLEMLDASTKADYQNKNFINDPLLDTNDLNAARYDDWRDKLVVAAKPVKAVPAPPVVNPIIAKTKTPYIKPVKKKKKKKHKPKGLEKARSFIEKPFKSIANIGSKAMEQASKAVSNVTGAISNATKATTKAITGAAKATTKAVTGATKTTTKLITGGVKAATKVISTATKATTKAVTGGVQATKKVVSNTIASTKKW